MRKAFPSPDEGFQCLPAFGALPKSTHFLTALSEAALFSYMFIMVRRHGRHCGMALPECSGLIGVENKATEARTLAFTQIHIDPEARTRHQMKYMMSWLP